MIALTRHVDFIVLAGDVLDSHERVNVQLLNRAYSLIRNLRQIAPVFILVGNHDYINNKQFLTDQHWMNGMKEWKNVTIVDTPVKHNTFVMVPYVPNGRLEEALSQIPNWKDASVVIAHQEIKGCKMGAITSLDGDEWKPEYPMLISGHVHDRQQHQPNVLYPGSVINHSFSHDNQGVSVFTVDTTGTVHEEQIDIGLEKKSVIYVNIEEIRNGMDAKENQKLSISAPYQDIAEFRKSKRYKTLKEQNVKVVFRVQSDESDYVQLSQSNFPAILSSLLKKEDDPELLNDYIQLR
jgi:DNA repair exonuclease SbcCD nuclease subunit